MRSSCARCVADDARPHGFEAVGGIAAVVRGESRYTNLRVEKTIAEMCPELPVTPLPPDRADYPGVPPHIGGGHRRFPQAVDADSTSVNSRPDIRDFGYAGTILVSTSMGGVMNIDEVIEATDPHRAQWPVDGAAGRPELLPSGRPGRRHDRLRYRRHHLRRRNLA